MGSIHQMPDCLPHLNNPNMNESVWQLLISVIKSLQDAPQWLRDFAAMSCDQATSLPQFGAESIGGFAAPSATEKPVTLSYLEFLREQIRLNASGAEWTRVLQERLNALLPLIGKNVITINLYCKPKSATLYIDLENGKLSHIEFYN
jgi:hypothetical protein